MTTGARRCSVSAWLQWRRERTLIFLFFLLLFFFHLIMCVVLHAIPTIIQINDYGRAKMQCQRLAAVAARTAAAKGNKSPTNTSSSSSSGGVGGGGGGGRGGGGKDVDGSDDSSEKKNGAKIAAAMGLFHFRNRCVYFMCFSCVFFSFSVCVTD
jgi:hypothetical protein